MKRENEPTNNHFLHFISFLAVYSSSSPVESLTRQRRFLVSNSIIARHWVDLTTISSSGPECRKGVRLPGGEVGWVPSSVDDEAERVNTINRGDDDLCCSFATTAIAPLLARHPHPRRNCSEPNSQIPLLGNVCCRCSVFAQEIMHWLCVDLCLLQ